MHTDDNSPFRSRLVGSVDGPASGLDDALGRLPADDGSRADDGSTGHHPAAAAAADIIILATTASTPIVDGRWFAPGTHINGVGSHAPKARELDSLTVQKSRVVCDLTGACKAEAGDLIIPAEAGEWEWDKVAGDLGDVVTGKVPGRTSRDQITLCKSVGLAIQDLSAARVVFDEAGKRGIGTEFQF